MIAARSTGGWLLALAIATTPLVARPAAHTRVIVTSTDIEILDDVTFVGAPSSLTISTRSLRTLDAMARTLVGNPAIARVEVQADTAARAQLCVDYLIGQGVDPARVVAGLHAAPQVAFVIRERASY